MKKTYSRKIAVDKYDFVRGVGTKVMEQYAKIILKYSKENANVLDLGFGNGQLLIPLAKLNNNSNIFGKDVSRGMCDQVSKTLNKENIEIECAGANSLSKSKNYFDLVHFKAILHCVKNPKKTLDVIAGSVKRNGYIITAHEESQSEDRIEQIFNYSKIDSPELELIFEYYFQLRLNMNKPFYSRPFPAGDASKAGKYLVNSKKFRLVKIISGKNLSWNKIFRIKEVLESMKLGTFGVFYENLTQKDRNTLNFKMLQFAKKAKIDINKKRLIPAKYKIFIIKKI